MVFLTTRLWLRNRLTDRYWRVQEVLKHARHFRGRKNRCYRTLWINRITAASQEHGLQYPAFISNLIKGFSCQVELNRKVLVDLAIYEPKTFKSLAALAKRRQQEGFAAALGDGKEPEGIFSRVVQYH
ncbi:39S ribosomal protein L20, mitochondrial [Apodemus speciosus]|uniref:39S ribosomal protein L20, mitochondrial n=1 Tax=Apodemus speciosus TaxID=105296 RepID=A0ABQ0ERB4_APOSI